MSLLLILEMSACGSVDVADPRMTHRPLRVIGDSCASSVFVDVSDGSEWFNHDSHHQIINFALFEECLGSSSVFDPSAEELFAGMSSDDTHDSSLDNCASAIHARRVSNEKSTAVERRPHAGGVGNGVELGVAEPEVFLWSDPSTGVFVCRAPSRCAVITERTNFKRRAEDKRTNLRARILAELRGCIDNLQIFDEFVVIEGH